MLCNEQTTITPRAHQIDANSIMASHPKHYLNHDCGTGKTITILMRCVAAPMPTVVIAPKTVMRTAWVEDRNKFAPQLSYEFAHGGKSAVKKATLSGADLILTTFNTFRLYADLFSDLRGRLVIDEASKCKNHEAATTRAIVLAAQRFQEVYPMSGTPAPNCPSEWFPQAACIDPNIFGTSYWRFVNTYFHAHRIKLRTGKEVVDRLTQSASQREAFIARLAPHVHTVKKADCLDLPPVTDIVVTLDLDDAERTAYDDIAEEFVFTNAHGERGRIKAEAALTKLRQTTGGGIYYDGSFVRFGDSKIEAMLEILEEIGPDEPVVIWAEFRSEIDRIAAACGADVLDGRTSGNSADIVNRFQAGKIKRLVCHPQAAGHGITLTRACYAIYFSLSFSLELFEQSRARLDRSGQTRPVTNYILCADRSIDRAIWKAIREKGDIARSVIDALMGNVAD